MKAHDSIFFSSRRRHTRCLSDWSSDVCSSDLIESPNPRPGPIVFVRQIQNGPLPQPRGIAHVAVQLREPFGIAPGSPNPPQVHFVGGLRAVDKIDPPTVRTPCQVVVVLIRAVPEYLTFVSAVAIRDEDWIAGVRCMVG